MAIAKIKARSQVYRGVAEDFYSFSILWCLLGCVADRDRTELEPKKGAQSGAIAVHNQMAKQYYEGYCDGTPTIFRVRDKKFGTAKVYAKSAQSLLTKATGYISAYDFTLNPYRGCQYGCSYCYAAAFSPNTRMRQDWGNWVIIKENAAELLKKELERWYRKNPHREPRIYMSTVTDPYQPIESKVELTRRLLEVMVEYRTILVIQTRSPAIVRDIDLLQRLQALRINMSIPTGSEAIRKDFEPRSPSIKARLNAVRKIRANIDRNTGYIPKLSITITPLLPTFPEQELDFIKTLSFVDRIIIQPFHQTRGQLLVASTRKQAIELKQKYRWWYENEEKSYQDFKDKLELALPNLEITEGPQGFGYD